MNRKKCPHCNKLLPVFLFTANRKRAASGDHVYFLCPHCTSVILAKSNEAHQKNFLWIFLVPLFATPLIISMSFVAEGKFRVFYYLSLYMLCLFVPVVMGQHKMDFFKSSEEEVQSFLDSLQQNKKEKSNG